VSAPAAATEHPAPAPLPVPEDVQVRSAVAYVSGPTADPERHLLDLYLPKEPRGFPTVVFVHGGGYQRGDRSVGHNLGVVLAHHGVAVASISYRLFPQVMHPGHITDVARAVAWVKSHIAESGGDPNRVFISGHSAGAHLAALLATDGSYLAGVGLKPADLAGVLSISGGYRINPIRKPVFGDDAALAAASPFAHLTGGHPPFLLIYGGLEKPDRADVSRELRDGLRAQGAWATCVVIPDRDHQGLLDHVAEGDPTSDLLLKTIAQLSQTPLPKPLD
jgi:acetyl esterase/lipase